MLEHANRDFEKSLKSHLNNIQKYRGMFGTQHPEN